MQGQVIGQVMNNGYAGSYSRQPDMVADSHPLTGSSNVPFGAVVVYGAKNDGGVVLPTDSTTAAQFLGVALREVKSATDYLNQNTGAYVQGDAVPVMKRGCVNVLCQRGTPAIGGAVYLRVKYNSSYANAVVGGLEAEADDANTVRLTNCQWKGTADANGIAEMRILTILNA